MSSYLQNRREEYTLNISASATTSELLSMQGKSLVGIIMPAAFDGTEISFQSSFDGVNFYDSYNSSGNLLSITVGTNRYIHLSQADFYGAKYIKLVSNATETVDRELKIILVGF